MKRMIVHHWAIRLLMPPIFGALAYLLILLIWGEVTQLETLFLSDELFFMMVLAYGISEGQHWAIRLLDWLIPKQIRVGVRLLIQTITSLALTVGLVWLASRIYFEEYLGTSVYATELRAFIQIWCLLTLLYLLLYYSALLHAQRNEHKLAQETTERQQLEYRVQAFNQETNPELLYTSLESLISLIHQDSAEAEKYLNRLSSVYRYILDRRHDDLVSVAEEVKTMENMVDLLNPAHQGHIHLSVRLSPEGMDDLLVPGTLPVLAEHLIRSNIITANLPLRIEVHQEDDYLVIENRLCPRLQPQTPNPRLERLQEAYGYYTTRPLVEVKVGEDQFFKVPMLALQTLEA